MGKEKAIKNPTQCDMIIQYIKDFGSITTWQAMQDLGIARLASRIWDLKQDGYEFEKKRVNTKNRYGKSTHYDEYRLKGEQTVLTERGYEHEKRRTNNIDVRETDSGQYMGSF